MIVGGAALWLQGAVRAGVLGEVYDALWNILACLDGYGRVGCAKASGMEGVAEVIGGSDSPIPSWYVPVADAT